MNLLGVERLEEIVSTVLLTGRLKQHSAVSCFLIAEHGSGKTSVVLEKQCESVVVLSDLTATGIKFTLQLYPRATHFILTDLGVLMGHSREAREFFFSMLLPLAEEGLRTIATPKGVEDYHGQQRAIIAPSIPQICRDNRKWWYARGLARRILPVNYSYPQELIVRIKDRIDDDYGASWKPGGTLKVPAMPLIVEFPAEHTRRVRAIADAKAKALGENGIDILKQYRAMARAHTLLRTWKRPKVSNADVEFIEMLDGYVSWTESKTL
jgi:hypothetical protein